MSRWAAAAAKRSVCVTTQSMSSPPPLPPVTQSFFGSMKPRATTASTPAIRSLKSSPG